MNREQELAALRKRAIKEFIIGTVVALIGALATSASYNAARPGGTYTVYTGAIALGIVYGIKGLFSLIFPKAALKMSQNMNKNRKSTKSKNSQDSDHTKSSTQPAMSEALAENTSDTAPASEQPQDNQPIDF